MSQLSRVSTNSGQSIANDWFLQKIRTVGSNSTIYPDRTRQCRSKVTIGVTYNLPSHARLDTNIPTGFNNRTIWVA